MRIIEENGLRKLIADEGKKIRSIDDIYAPSYIDEEGNEVPENIPYYTNIIYLGKNFDESKLNELYIEE